MELNLDLNQWSRLLSQLETSDNKISKNTLLQLTRFFYHLPSQYAPRHRRDYEQYIVKSEKLLAQIFDKLDLSDKPLLCIMINLMKSYGFARISQITYHVGHYELAQLEQVPIYFCQIEKNHWYTMSPLLPEAGTLGWENVMNHGLVHEEPELFNACLQLLCQKLQFYSIIVNLDKYKNSLDIIKRNGGKVVKKLIELIRDASCDDQTTVGLDSFLFGLLMQFSKQEQQETIIDAIVLDLFQPFDSKQIMQKQDLDKILDLVNCCILNQTQLQNVLISKILEHLRCNLISRKRRHSEVSDEDITIELILDNIRNDNFDHSLSEIESQIKISPKKFRHSYLSYWIDTVDSLLTQRTIRDSNTLKLLSTCLIILITASNLMNEELANQLTHLMAKVVDFTGPFRLDKLFKTIDPLFLIEMTKILSEKTSIMSGFQAPIQKFYKFYFHRFLRYTLIKADKIECEKMNKFVEFACDKNIGKDTSHLLQYICVHELAGCLEGKVNNKITEIYLESARNCGKRLYKFIKRNISIKNKVTTSENGFGDEDMNTTSDFNNSSIIESIDETHKKTVVVDTLVCILRVAIIRKDQELLDTYGDILLKLFDFITCRVEVLISVTKTGKTGSSHPLDAYMPKLLTLYTENSEMIKGYLSYELISKLADLLLDEETRSSNSCYNNIRSDKKSIYNHLKSKLDGLEQRAKKSMDVYPAIINKQFGLVVEQSITNHEVKKEKSCCAGYWNEMKTLYEIYSIVFTNCEVSTYEAIVNQVVESLEQCDPLDHPKVLYLLLLLETLVPKYQYTNFKTPGDHFDPFRRKMGCMSTSMLRIAKSVELGPSIHVFTNSGSHKTGKAAQCCTYANCIKLYTQLFNRYPSNWTNALVTDAMQMCVSSNLIQYAKYTERMQRFFVQLASSITGLLKSMFMYKKEEEVLRPSMAIFLSVFLDLIRCLIIASDRQKLTNSQHTKLTNGHNGTSDIMDTDEANEEFESRNSQFESQLELLALDMAKILNNLSSLRVKLVDYAPHLISTYVKDIQRASCPEFVKLHLNEGIFRIFNLVDAHQRQRLEEIVEAGVQRKTTAGRASGSLFDMIHARLDQASREIFKAMHDDYNRFHRYQGKC